ncbi:MAG TPA: head GIN domain-containing protein [Myxococcaceae bacterium]|nr:head GIN domain-containing protein [Myxococcaceae bacterium]
MRALLPRVAPLAACLLVLPARAETVRRSVTGFKKVELRVPLDVTIRSGKEFSLALDLRDPDTADKISTEVRGDTLVISSNAHSLSLRGKNSAAITLPELRGVALSGSGNADVSGFEGGDMDLSISGSGDITYSGKPSTLSVAISGSGNVRLTGSCSSMSVAVSGSGNVRAADFAAKNASVAISGSGDAELHITGGAVQFTVNGSGDIRWTGEAATVSAVTHGSGSIQKKR